jgi:hypothetical protein
MKRGVATPYGITKRASRKNDWKFSPAAFFGRQGLGEVYSAEQVYLAIHTGGRYPSALLTPFVNR